MNKYIDRLFENSTGFNLKVLQKALDFSIPFNIPHKFKTKILTKSKCEVLLPFIRKNKNHLGGIHACAMATIGEFTAGLLLIKNVGFSRYRLIMSDLSVEYKFQGRTNLKAICESPISLESLKQQIAQNEKAIVDLVTNLYDEKENLVASVKTTWQLKDWKKVKLK